MKVESKKKPLESSRNWKESKGKKEKKTQAISNYMGKRIHGH